MMSSSPWQLFTLPLLTTLIGTGGLTVGVYSFINPVAAARIYGVPVRTSAYTLTSVLSGTTGTTPASPTRTPSISTAKFSDYDASYIHALGIRNMTAGLTIITLTAYWHFTLSVSSHDAQVAVQRALGIVILLGSCVPLIDAWICWTSSNGVSHGKGATRGGKDVRSKLTNVSDRDEAFQLGRNAAFLHASRSLVWITGALWCLFG